MNKITPFLWFDKQAGEAAHFYVSIFKNSSITKIRGSGDAISGVSFVLDGQEFHALNGGPMFQFNPAISMYVNCETQAEVDDLWDKLSAGGTPQRCGWLQDKYGLSWQIIPTILPALLQDPDAKKAERARMAMMKMVKIDIETLKRASEEI